MRGDGDSTTEYAQGGSSGTLWQDRADKHLVSLDSGDTLWQGGALGDGKVVHLLAGSVHMHTFHLMQM